MVPDATAMRAAIDSYVAQGYTVAVQDGGSASMVKRKEFSVPIAIIGFLFCVIGLVIYAIVFSSQSDQMVRIVVSGGATSSALQVSADGRWWWSAQRQAWVGVLEELPVGTQVSPDRRWWWDGASWREFPSVTDTNRDGSLSTADAGPAPVGLPGPTNSTTVLPQPGDPLPPPQPR